MGQIRFFAPRPERVLPEAVERAYLAGLEQIPWRCRNRWADGELIIERQTDESGNLYMLWQVEGHGQLVLSTASLMERPEPYNLPLELARGTVNRLRNQLAQWEPQGFVVSDQLRTRFETALDRFVTAATLPDDPVQAAEVAEQTIVDALDAIDLLGRDFTEQVLALRHQAAERLSTLLAARLDQRLPQEEQLSRLLAAFNAAVVPLNWRAIETSEGQYNWETPDQQIAWCHEHGLKVCAGPLLRLSQYSLPDWSYLWEDDFNALHSSAMQYVEATVRRYQDKVHIWHVAAGMNTNGKLALSEELRLRLTVRAIQTVAELSPRVPIIVSFDQPWAEYLARQELELAPLHFADALVRSDLGLAGIGLEINFAYWPDGTLPRDLLEVNRLIDYWSHLGLPLLIMLTVPSSAALDPKAEQAATPLADAFPGGLSPEAQCRLVEHLVPMLTAKQCVHAVIWNQLCDAEPHEFPHGGLFDAQGRAKPALDVLARLRGEHLI